MLCKTTLVGVLTIGAVALPAMVEASVELEIITGPRSAITAQQRWLQALKGQPQIDSLRFRSARTAPMPQIDQQGQGPTARYRITAVLGANDVLHVPGGRFRLSERQQLLDWIAQLQQQGQQGLSEPRDEFGLTAEQRRQVQRDLQQPLTFSTAGRRGEEVIEQIERFLTLPLQVDRDAANQLHGRTIDGELQGIACGTALAAILRAWDLALVPQSQGGGLQLRIVRSGGDAAWPIGQAPERRVIDLLPKLSDFLQVQVTDTPLPKVLDALQPRIGAPLLWDSQALRRRQIDPTQVKVSIPSRRMTYQRALGRVLFAARLEADVRVDDAGRPFIWITTIGG